MNNKDAVEDSTQPARTPRRDYHGNPAVASASRRVSSLSKRGNPDDPELAEARRDLRFVKFREYAREAVSAWPPFTPGQHAALDEIIHGHVPASDD